MIEVAREIRFALDRLKYLDPEAICLTIDLNPPLESVAILKALEIQLPFAYAAFLLEVGNGGGWDCAERDCWMTFDEIMQHNCAELWHQSPPDFVRQFLATGKQSDAVELPYLLKINALPGLLRIGLYPPEQETYGLFLTQEGHEVKIQICLQPLLTYVVMERYTPKQWLQMHLNFLNNEIYEIEKSISILNSQQSPYLLFQGFLMGLANDRLKQFIENCPAIPLERKRNLLDEIW
ncbi:hypothetical protein [Anabaena sp. CCY 9910]|uniref:hypothetical protein n=1 Tax=Anabaena sp. CCY 9910 TaxID=3103870 RepID=UPI0039DFA0DC